MVITNVFDAGQLRIVKDVTGDGAGYADRDFVFRVECVLLAPGIPPTVMVLAPVTATIDRPDETEVVVDDLPVTRSCAVYETDNGGASPPCRPRVELVDTVVIGPDDQPPVVVDAVNDFPAGLLTLSKSLTGDGAGVGTDIHFVLEVTCEREQQDGTFATFLTEDVTLDRRRVVTLDDAPAVGSRCWAVETDDGGATSVDVDFDSADNDVTVTEDAPAITISAVNTFDVGSLRLVKTVTGEGAAFADHPSSSSSPASSPASRSSTRW